eukprot:106643-Rhodomonas_salina.2
MISGLGACDSEVGNGPAAKRASTTLTPHAACPSPSATSRSTATCRANLCSSPGRRGKKGDME